MGIPSIRIFPLRDSSHGLTDSIRRSMRGVRFRTRLTTPWKSRSKNRCRRGLGLTSITLTRSRLILPRTPNALANGAVGGNVLNSWSPNQLRGPSDFDLRHQINAHWYWQLPIGIGRAYAGHIGKGLDAVIGGWQISGLTRWSSGFPVNVGTCFCFETNWQLTGEAIATAKVSGGRATLINEPSNGGPLFNIFKNGPSESANFAVPLPGFSGARNQIRGDGFFDTDLEVGKAWKMPYNESHELRLVWDTFNVFNLKRFDVQSASLSLDNAATFGNYTHLLTNPRVMQFALRYQF